MAFTDRGGEQDLADLPEAIRRTAEPNTNWVSQLHPPGAQQLFIYTYKEDPRLFWGSAGIKVWESMPRDHLSPISWRHSCPQDPLSCPAWLCHRHTLEYFWVFTLALNYAKPHPSPRAFGSQRRGRERLNLQVSCDRLWRSNYSALTGILNCGGWNYGTIPHYVSGCSTLSHWGI